MFYAVSGLKQKSQTVVKGTITFGGEISFKETVNVNGQNKTIWEGGIDPDPIIPGNSDLLHALEMIGTIGYHPVIYTVKILSPDHVQLTHGLILNDENRVSGIQNSTIDMTSNGGSYTEYLPPPMLRKR